MWLRDIEAEIKPSEQSALTTVPANRLVKKLVVESEFPTLIEASKGRTIWKDVQHVGLGLKMWHGCVASVGESFVLAHASLQSTREIRGLSIGERARGRSVAVSNRNLFLDTKSLFSPKAASSSWKGRSVQRRVWLDGDGRVCLKVT